VAKAATVFREKKVGVLRDNDIEPEILAGISRWAIIIFAVTISLEQLGIAPLLVTATFNIILGGIVLALALAFGLGGKDAAAKYLEELRQKRSGK